MATDDFKARRHPRVDARWAIDVNGIGWQETLHMETVDLSRSGAFIQTEVETSPGLMVQLVFHRTNEASISTFAKIVRKVQTETMSGVGVEFVDPPEDLVDWIAESVEPNQVLSAPSELFGEGWWKPALDQALDAPEPVALGYLGEAPQKISPAEMELLDAPTRPPYTPTNPPLDPDLARGLARLQESLRSNPSSFGDDTQAFFSSTPPAAFEDDDDKINIDQALILYRRAEADLEAGDFLAAQDTAQRLRTAFPKNKRYRVLFHIAAGGLFKARGDMANAALHWEDAIAIDSTCANAIAALRDLGETNEQRAKAKRSWLARLGLKR